MKGIRINMNVLKWVALALGVLGILVMAGALIANQEFEIVGYIALGVGVIGLAGYVILDMDAIVATLVGRRGQFAMITVGVSLLFVVVLVILYIVVDKLPVDPIDFTEERQYSLSPQTLDLLSNLDEEVEAYGFFDPGSYYFDQAEIWMDLYVTHSNGMVSYEVIDPNREPGRATQLGMSRNNSVMFRQGDRVGTTSAIDEQDLAGALLQALQGEPRVIYALSGHNERDLSGFAERDYQTIRTAMELENMTIQSLTLSEPNAAVPEDADAVLILGPMGQLSTHEVDALEAYLADGGAMMLLIDPTVSTMVITSGVQGVAYSHDGERLVSASSDDTARVWDASTGEELLTLAGHTSDVLSAEFSPDDGQIATAGADGTVRLWDAETGEEVGVLEGHLASVLRAQYSPAGGVLASVGEDQALILWDLATLEPIAIQSIQAPMFALAYAPDGSAVAAGAADGSVVVWDGATGEPIFQSAVHTNIIFGLAFSPEDGLLYSAAIDGTLGVVDYENGSQSTLPISPDMGITDLAFFPDGQLVFSLTDATVHVLGDDDNERVFAGHEDLVWRIAISPDGDSFATAGQDGVVLVWNLDSDEPVLTLTGHTAGDPLQNYLANAWGIGINDDLVVDLETEWVFDALTPIAFGDRYASTSTITLPLMNVDQQTFFVQARSLDPTSLQPGTVSVTALVQTSEMNSWGETNPYVEEIAPDGADIPGPRPLAMSAEDSVTGSRVVVIGDADVASNQVLRNASYANDDLFLNAVNWLTEDEDLISEREAATARTFNPLSPPLLALALFLSVCGLPLLILIAGSVVWLSRRNR